MSFSVSDSLFHMEIYTFSLKIDIRWVGELSLLKRLP